MIVANMEDFKNGAKPYYTNSTHLPVNQTDDLFEALSVQDALQTLYTGGTVFHIFTGESRMSENAAKNTIRKVCENFRLPYVTLSPSFSVCPSHGYISGEHFKCPKCGADSEVFSRIVGYMRRFHNGTTASAKNFSIENYSIKAYPNANLTSRNAKHANRRIRKTKLHRLGWKIGCGSFHARLQLALFLLPQPFLVLPAYTEAQI
ncbi:MAG: anaerobic ribonucleoside-triphosphate reductase [Bacilli bacterium]